MAVYFVTEQDTQGPEPLNVKVGYSSDLKRRRGQLQTGNPRKLVLMSQITDGELHPCFRTLGYFTPVHERGTKWDSIEELQTALQKFKEDYNEEWLIQRHGHRSPNQFRCDAMDKIQAAA